MNMRTCIWTCAHAYEHVHMPMNMSDVLLTFSLWWENYCCSTYIFLRVAVAYRQQYTYQAIKHTFIVYSDGSYLFMAKLNKIVKLGKKFYFKMRHNQKFLWAPPLCVDRRQEPILDNVLKVDEKHPTAQLSVKTN